MTIVKSSSNQNVPTSKKVNQIGKYLYRNLDGAFKYDTSSNTCDVYVTLLYQVPLGRRIPDSGEEYDVNVITLNLSLTTYQNKIRVNVIEVTPQKRTLGYDLYPPEKLDDLETAKNLIFKQVCRRIAKAYSEYDFLF